MRCLYDGEHPCGKCPACMANRQRAFMFRLDQEKDHCAFYFWLTLTYDDVNVPKCYSYFYPGKEEMCFSKEHCHAFFEKLRKRYKKHKLTFKHFLVSEYGPNETHRPHYHCLLMVYSDKDLGELYLIRKEMKNFILEKAWPHGNVKEKPYHGGVLKYLTKYCMKPQLLGEKHTMKPFTLISRGIGLNLLDRIPKLHLQQMIDNLDFTYHYNGGKIQLPRYYVDKILPHGAADLRALFPNDPQNGDWTPYLEMVELRKRFQAKQESLALQHAKKRSKETFQQKQDRIEYAFSVFRSKCKSRKNL